MDPVISTFSFTDNAEIRCIVLQHFYQAAPGVYSFNLEPSAAKANHARQCAGALVEGMATGYFDVVAHPDRIFAYDEDMWKVLTFQEIECFTVISGKVYAIDGSNRRYRLKQRLYEVEALLPSFFIRINKSALANETRLERFVATYSGGVNARFLSGYEEYVSRRCFAAIKRRFDSK